MNYDLNIVRDNDVPNLVNDFLNYLSTIKGKSKNTISGYKVDLIMFFRFLKLYKGLSSEKIEFEDIVISDIDASFIKAITLQDLYAFISFTKSYRNNGEYARARKVATLKSFFKYLSGKAKIIIENPAIELESPKIKKRNPIYLTLDESKSLLNSVQGRNCERNFCIITLFLNCGMRLSELCGIRISSIKGDTLTVIGKGDKERTIYLNNSCLRAIKNYLIVRNEKSDKILPINKDFLFLSEQGTPINKRQVERIVKQNIQKAGLDINKYTPHKLRHTAATLMYKHGSVDIRSLQQILGHENISTTQIYTHIDDERLREAVNSNPLNE